MKTFIPVLLGALLLPFATFAAETAATVVVAVVLILAVVFMIAKESAKQQRNVPMVGQMTCPRCGHVDSYFQTGAHCPNCGHPMT